MKKVIVGIAFVFLFIAGCSNAPVDIVDISTINDLTALQKMVAQVNDGVAQGRISSEEARSLITKLQERYFELTDITQENIEAEFAVLEKSLSSKSSVPYSLPFRAKKLGMTEPTGMVLNTVLSKHYANEEGYDSTILVYTGEYDHALQQAEYLAKKAGLHISKTFEQGKVIANSKDVRYVSGLDIEGLEKGIVYANHDLLDKDIDVLLSVSVDQNGNLILEATKYK